MGNHFLCTVVIGGYAGNLKRMGCVSFERGLGFSSLFWDTPFKLPRDIMISIIDTLNSLIWSKALVGLCLLTGLYFTIATRFLQVRMIPTMVRCLWQGKSSKRGVSSFQAFALAISGRVGTGNIAGVATAIAMGGPGAVFWMWAIAFLGAGSAFVESTLAQLYKSEVDGQFRGGPAEYIERGLKVKWYAVLFAISTVAATGFCLPGIQSNSIGLAVENAFSLSPVISGGIVVVLLGLIIFGGIKRIGQTAQLVVPLMALGYVVIALVVVALNYERVPGVFALIFENAFSPSASFGGIVGSAVMWGVKRGIYSNEAGQGTGPIAAATAAVNHPAKQGLVQAFSVYIDTWFVCTATALMILVTKSYNVANPEGGWLEENLAGVESGPAFTQQAVDTVFAGYGSGFVAIALLFFAFTTLMAYYYYAESNLSYLIKGSALRGKAIAVLRIAFLGVVFWGSVKSASMAWALGDIGVGLMAWLNLVAILLLSRPALRCLRDFERQAKEGEVSGFDAEANGIPNAPFWTKR